jgi:hypothetical protein
MFKRNNPIETMLDAEILTLLEMMGQENDYSDDYKQMATHVTNLIELRQKEKISKDTWMTVGTHVVGLIVLMNHERAHVIASKAFSLVKKIV